MRAPPTSPSQGPTGGVSCRPRPKLNDRIVLQGTNVKAGTPIRGELVVVNRGERPFSLLTHGCHPASAVVLTNGTITALPGFTTECLTRPLVISPGENRLAMSVATTYSTCSGTPAQSTAAAPACPPGPQQPPLPAGRYRAFLVGTGLALPDPPPVTVVLTDTRGD